MKVRSMTMTDRPIAIGAAAEHLDAATAQRSQPAQPLCRRALLEGEDDALVDGTAFQLAVGLGGLLHGHGVVRAQAEPAIG